MARWRSLDPGWGVAVVRVTVDEVWREPRPA